MFRFLTIALLAGAAIPAAAFAQDNEGPRTGAERREAAAAQRAERGPRAERPANVERAPRAERQRDFAAPSAAPAAAAQPQARQDRGGWRGNRGGEGGWRANQRQAVPAAQAQSDTGWTAPPRSQRGPELRALERQDTTGRGGEINRNRNAQNRDWNRNNDQRRDWNRNDQRRDWNDGRRYDNDRRWDGNRNTRNWNRSWRNDRRYDWQGYRNSNRYAYRLPRYYAPSGWRYGYRRFDIGATLFAGLFDRSYWIGDPYSYRLPPVEWPYQWVRYYDDALLVDTETGQVVESIPGIFW